MNAQSELDLIGEFAERRNEASFGELVRRHLDLVYSAALRLVVDPHLAEDVSQAVFTALAGQADAVAQKLARGATLSGWLHVTTRNLAAKAVRTEVRRRAREQEAMAMHELSAGDGAAEWEHAPLLDHALGDLPEADRDALLLRFFERKSAREIGERLGVSEEAAQKRVTRALDRLRDRFISRGAALPASAGAALATILGAHAVQAAPLTLRAGVAKAALAASSLAAGPFATAAASAPILSALAMTKTQVAVLIAIAAVFAIPLGIHQSALNDLRASAAHEAAFAPDPITTPPAMSRSPRESEADELARLRHEADALRSKLAARRSPTERIASARIPGPTLLEKGKPARLSELVFAANVTPEAALQSVLAFRRDGDVDGVASLMLLAPERAARFVELLASPENREQMAQDMIATTAGVVMQSAVRLDESGAVVSSQESIKMPLPGGNATAEIIEQARIDDRRVQFSLRLIRGGETNVEYLTFGLTRNGWKSIE